ncbi:MAG: cysteine synthase A [Psychrilyobacter sp.]|uniref:cysteine synthase A n=1 Tax=Psychrilyobacter sp. TaxID=2586924 RepID=UPI003C74FE84
MYSNIVELIGNTPMVKLKKEKGLSDIYVKLEKFNPSGSIKDRAAYQMIVDAEADGKLNQGDIILEPTSGNTGVALAMIGKAMGYEVTLVMPSSMSQERKDIISSYGANLVLSDPTKGMTGAINKAYEMAEANSRYYIPNQFENKSNIKAHYISTGIEIYNQIPQIDCFVAGVGTGGTLGGTGKYLKERNKNIKVVAVEPSNSPVLSGGNGGPHKIQGIGAGFIPQILDISIIDEVITIDDETAYKITRNILNSDGLYLGISSGSNIAAAKILAKKLGEGKIIVTVAPDGGEKYISTGVFTK